MLPLSGQLLEFARFSPSMLQGIAKVLCGRIRSYSVADMYFCPTACAVEPWLVTHNARADQATAFGPWRD
jgi:hypothetical protein